MKKIFFVLFLLNSISAIAQPSIWGGFKVELIKKDSFFHASLGDIKTWMGLSGGGTVSSVSSGNLSPLFTVNISNPTSTPAFAFTLSNAAANTYLGNATGSSGAPSYTAAGALTKTDDTNVTLSLGGNASTSLLRDASITVGWSGTLAVSRGGIGTGTLTGIAVGNGTSAFTAITNSSTVGQVLRVTGAASYAWGALDLGDGDAVTNVLPTANGGTGLSAVGGDNTLLGSNGSANIYYTLSVTHANSAFGFARNSGAMELNIPNATTSLGGIVSTTTQGFDGNKTWGGTHTQTGLFTANGGAVLVASSSQAAMDAHGVHDGTFTTITANTTVDHQYEWIFIGTLTGNITVTLPACNTTRDGWEYNFMKKGTDSFAFILDPTGSETFYDGELTKSFWSQGMTAHCKCENGLGWNVTR